MKTTPKSATLTKLDPKVRRAIRLLVRTRKKLWDSNVHSQSPEGLAIARRAAQAAAVIDRHVGGPRKRTELIARLRREQAISSEGDAIASVDLCELCYRKLDRNGVVRIFRILPAGGSVTERVVCEDCDFKERVTEYEKTGELTRWLVEQCSSICWWLDNPRENYRKEFTRRARRYAETARRVNADVDRIHAAVKRFEREAWFAGLQRLVVEEKEHRGHSGEKDGVKMLSYCMAARWMGTITDAKTGCNVTVITEEKSSKERMYMKSLAATADKAIRLLDYVREHWQELGLRVDDEVSIG